MRKVIVFLSLVAVGVSVLMPAGAQTQPKTIARIITVRAKAGQGQQWEDALKSLQSWEHQQSVPGTSFSWNVISGDGFGAYVFGTFGHDWNDFDIMQAEGEKVGIGKEIGQTVAPYTASVKISYYRFLPDVSTPITPGLPPTPMSVVTFFTLKPGGVEPVLNAIKQVGAGMEKTHWKGNGNPAGWYELVDGGEGPQLVLSIGLKNWAGLKEGSPSLVQMLVQAFGKAGAHAIEHEFDSNVRSVYTEIIRYRPDLSYNAPVERASR